MIKVATLLTGMFLFLAACADRDFYVAKLYNNTVSISIPTSWQVIALKNYNSSENLIYNKFIGDSVKLDGLELDVYRETVFPRRTLNEIIVNEMALQMRDNTETKITDHDLQVVNDNQVGVIRYTFGFGDNKIWYGETILILKGERLYKIRLFSKSESVEASKVKCASITASIKVRV